MADVDAVLAGIAVSRTRVVLRRHRHSRAIAPSASRGDQPWPAVALHFRHARGDLLGRRRLDFPARSAVQHVMGIDRGDLPRASPGVAGTIVEVRWASADDAASPRISQAQPLRRGGRMPKPPRDAQPGDRGQRWPARRAMSRACVIGAGLGGLSLAIRLQTRGRRNHAGRSPRERRAAAPGRWQREGFTFDAGPGAIVDPAGLDELWQLSGSRLARRPRAAAGLARSCGSTGRTERTSTIRTTRAALRREVARLAPGRRRRATRTSPRYAAHAAQGRHDPARQGSRRSTWQNAAGAVPGLIRHQAWRSLHAMVSSFVKDEKLREAFSVQLLLAGGNPAAAATALHALATRSSSRTARGGPRAASARLPRQWRRCSSGSAARCGCTIRCCTSTRWATG